MYEVYRDFSQLEENGELAQRLEHFFAFTSGNTYASGEHAIMYYGYSIHTHTHTYTYTYICG